MPDKSDVVHKSVAVVKKRLVIDITRMTVHNGPGIRTVIFFKGCPLRCLWCSTPESQKETPEIALFPEKCIGCGDCLPVCPRAALSPEGESVVLNRSLCDNCGTCASVCYAEALKKIGHPYTVDELVREVIKDKVIYRHSGGGVTISGGEPLLYPDFTFDLLKELKKNGIGTGVDTCGFVPRENIESVLPYVDFFLWDIKHMDREKHIEYTGVSNDLILDNLRFVSEKGIPVYLRLPLIPGYNDSDDNLLDMCQLTKSLPSLVEVHLLPMHHLGSARYAALGREYPIEGLPLFHQDILTRMKRLVESTGLTCNIVG